MLAGHDNDYLGWAGQVEGTVDLEVKGPILALPHDPNLDGKAAKAEGTTDLAGRGQAPALPLQITRKK